MPTDFTNLSRMAAYGLAIFAGAILLFQVQPLMGKYLLPWFGGVPTVWTTRMLNVTSGPSYLELSNAIAARAFYHDDWRASSTAEIAYE